MGYISTISTGAGFLQSTVGHTASEINTALGDGVFLCSFFEALYNHACVWARGPLNGGACVEGRAMNFPPLHHQCRK